MDKQSQLDEVYGFAAKMKALGVTHMELTYGVVQVKFNIHNTVVKATRKNRPVGADGLTAEMQEMVYGNVMDAPTGADSEG